MPILDQAFETARTLRPLTKDQISKLLNKTGKAAADGRYELYKTSAHFDSTAENPKWLGGETENIKKMAS